MNSVLAVIRYTAYATMIFVTSDAFAQFKPVDFPKDTGIPDFVFPAPSATIDNWVQKDDVASMAAHTWGLWVGVNMDSGEMLGGQSLRVFETWNEKSELPVGPAVPNAVPKPRLRTPRALRQFRFQNGKRVPMTAVPANSPLGFVKFDPTAADHIVKNKLLLQETLDNLVDPTKIANVPDFPSTAISLKVETVPTNEDPMNPGYFKFSVWPGPPATPRSFGPALWNSFVWIDLNPANPNTGDGSVGHGADNRKPGNTYSITQFLNLKDSSGKTQVVAGMHMTTREITQWTWQTFWWTPDATTPPAPSSQQIAAARPKQLLTMGAPAHYAVALAYSMRTSTGGNVFGYNPYLEASFSGLAGSFPFGVQTNCMSCHANASYTGIPAPYVGNENIDIAGPQFKGQVRLDFLYSLEP